MELKLSRENWALGLVVIATLLTGTLGVFKTFLTDAGMNNYEVSFVKFFLATIVIGVALAIKDRESLKLKRWQDLGFLFFFSLVNIGFTVAIFFAMDSIGVALSAALQSTNAYFVLILAAIFFSEKITTKKVLAVCLGFVGCLFVINVFDSDARADLVGIILAIGSALGVAVFWLGCKYAGKKGYTPGGTLFYMFLISTIILMVIPDVSSGSRISLATDIGNIIDITFNKDMAWFYVIGAGIIATMIPKYMITEGFQTADAGKASVCVTFDMVTSAIFGAIFLNETLYPVTIVGIAMIIFSIAMIELKYFDKFFKGDNHGEAPT